MLRHMVSVFRVKWIAWKKKEEVFWVLEFYKDQKDGYPIQKEKKRSKFKGDIQRLRALTALSENWGLIPSTPHSDSQWSVTPGPRNPAPSSDLQGHFKHVCTDNSFKQNPHTQNNKIRFKT